MKKSKLFLFINSISMVSLVTTPLLTSCTNSSDLKIVTRGDGTYFAKYENDEFLSTTFKEQIKNSLMDSSSYEKFKREYASELIYNWYYNSFVKDGTKHPDMKDKWTKWIETADEKYKEDLDKAKSAHGDDWAYYFQNETLDPVGGTEQSYKFTNICDNIRTELTSLAFPENYPYLAYSDNNVYNVENEIKTFTYDIFSNSDNWKNVNFYARGNSSYSINNFDDVYALIGKTAFDLWTANTHPFSVSMSLWKYAEPKEGIRSIYSSKVIDSDDNNDDDVPDSLTEIKASYELPSFPVYDGTENNANAKFYNLFTKYITANDNYGIDNNGISVLANKSNLSTITDDSAVSFIVTANDAFDATEDYFSGAAANLWSSYSGGNAVDDKFLQFDINDLSVDIHSPSNTDILSSFLYRSNDHRVFQNNNQLTDFGITLRNYHNEGYLTSLNNNFEYCGNPSDLNVPNSDNSFHSFLFTDSANYKFDYYGHTNNEGGVQWVANGLRLLDNNIPLPYVLIRDSFGVHLIGLNGAWKRNDVGYLGKGASDEVDNTQPYSQGRENILLKAQSLSQKQSNYTSDNGVDIVEKIKTYFNSHMDDVIINMARNEIKRGNNAGGGIIFDHSELLNDANITPLYTYLDKATQYFMYQTIINSIDTVNKKMFNAKMTNTKNALISMSNSFKGMTNNNYKNGLASPYPFKIISPDDASNVVSSYINSHVFYDVVGLIGWAPLGMFPSTNDFINSRWTNQWSTNLTVNNITDRKSDLAEYIDRSLINNITPNIQNDKIGKYSEHIYPKWQDKKENKIIFATDPITNGIYKALAQYAGLGNFAYSTKIKAMQKYAVGDNKVVNDFDDIDSLSGFANIRTESMATAIASEYYSTKLLSDNDNLSYFANLADKFTNYENFLKNAYQWKLRSSFTSNTYNENVVNYWTFLDTVQYLSQNNYENLINYLKQNVLKNGQEANLVWLVKDNIHCNPDFINNDLYGNDYEKFFKWQNNFNGIFSNRYLHVDNNIADATPTSYVDNSSYYQYAPMPIGMGAWEKQVMGYVGLVTESNTPNTITTNISDQLFHNGYYSKRLNNGLHLGGWYKYINYENLIALIKGKSSIIDLKNIADELIQGNKYPWFTQYVYDIVNHTTYQAGDPEVVAEVASVGEPVLSNIVQERFLGGSYQHTNKNGAAVTINYDDIQWGLNYYWNQELTQIDINNLFWRFGDANGASELCDGDNLMSISHTIKLSNDEANANDYARIYTIQLNYDDISSYDKLFSALGGDGDPDVQESAQTLLDLITVQFALNSSNQTHAIQEVIKTVYNNNKITVFDRRLNDNLGQIWVKNWKATN